MAKAKLRFSGVELYFDDLPRAKEFYCDVLGLGISGEQPGHHVQFGAGQEFICLERKGVEDYPSRDKAVLFFEVSDLGAALQAIGRERIVKTEAGGTRRPAWAVLHDPEGHNILLLEAKRRRRSRSRK